MNIFAGNVACMMHENSLLFYRIFHYIAKKRKSTCMHADSSEFGGEAHSSK